MKRLICLLGLALAALALVELIAPVFAVSRPHTVRATGRFINGNNPRDFTAEGTATHWGKFTNAGKVLFTEIKGSPLVKTSGSSVYIAANGDKINAVFTGTLDPKTGVGTGTVNWVGGTGRFAKATGTMALKAQVFPDGSFGSFVAELNGTIDY
jgi:hypothetical protein